MKAEAYNQKGEVLEEIEIPKNIFDVAFNSDLVYQVYKSLLSNQRKPLAFTKNRAEVRGGGKKPWAQKGTGRARHGSIRSPIWKGGGATFGPRQKEENWKKKVNKKMKKASIKIILSQKLKDKEIKIIDKFELKEIKTKEFFNVLKQIFKKDITKSILMLLDKKEQNLKRALKNIPRIEIINVSDVNLLNLLNNKFVILSKEALAVLEKQLV
ncbi:MAG: 50S ribosomal protein L4 [Candidatus Paceibacterota bacterium]|jgi:large subunit ribosomal protein L4